MSRLTPAPDYLPDSFAISTSSTTEAAQRVAERLAPYIDSITTVNTAEQRARDWTITGSNGARWGVSPARIRMGSITIPLQFLDTGTVMIPSAGRRDEYTNRLRTFSEIQEQAARSELRKTFEARVRAIRERNVTKRDSIR